VEKLLAFVRVRFTAAAAGFDAEEMRFHGFVAPSEKFHANALGGLKDTAIARRNKAGVFLGVVKKRKKVGAIKARDASQSGDRGAHLAAFEGAKKTNGDACGPGDLRERKIAFLAKAAEALAGRENALGGNGDNALAFENVNDGGGIETARPAKENGALQEADIFIGVEAIFALRALRNDETEGFPSSQSGRRNADAASHFADAKERLGRMRFECFG